MFETKVMLLPVSPIFLQLYPRPPVYISFSESLFGCYLVALFLCGLVTSTVAFVISARVQANSIVFFLAGSARSHG